MKFKSAKVFINLFLVTVCFACSNNDEQTSNLSEIQSSSLSFDSSLISVSDSFALISSSLSKETIFENIKNYILSNYINFNPIVGYRLDVSGENGILNIYYLNNSNEKLIFKENVDINNFNYLFQFEFLLGESDFNNIEVSLSISDKTDSLMVRGCVEVDFCKDSPFNIASNDIFDVESSDKDKYLNTFIDGFSYLEFVVKDIRTFVDNII